MKRPLPHGRRLDRTSPDWTIVILGAFLTVLSLVMLATGSSAVETGCVVPMLGAALRRLSRPAAKQKRPRAPR